jgi:hypothetical protein
MPEALAPAAEAGLRRLIAEVERVFPDMEASYIEDTWWRPVGPVDPCECCGTVVFLLEDTTGARRWCQVGPRPPAGEVLRLPVHTPERCRDTSTPVEAPVQGLLW